MRIRDYSKPFRGGRTRLWTAAACCLALAVPAVASAAEGGSQGARSATPGSKTALQDSRSPYLSDWFHQHVSLIGSAGIRFGPTHVDDIYLEYEFAGTKGPFDLYGYVDVHKILGIGNDNDTGFWDDGSPLFTELEPRMSFNRLLGKDLSIGPIKEWFLATDYILDVGNGRDSRQNVLYFGPGVSFDTHSRVNFELNFFFRRQFADYGAPNSFSWDGYRIQPNVSIPITTLTTWGHEGHLTYVGFANYDFGSDLGDEAGPTRTNHALVETNVLILSYTRLRYFFAARYFHNGGQWNDGAVVNFPNGPRRLDQNGWGYYLAVGWKF
ncbi:nucleoside-specific channel-forming protein Tsx [Salinisphaera sp.]|uniref:nucleoside-specific channel-forming protein Tsx n=1 Tax=Salinisphaera sp. TaxID=1914330 RepID=UPI002D7898A1|nr:nucleoside-specific channel-forming protein Tsx [Salinisphaera sp.]HET7314909.1 nucleoside-specific channel-forming protein Tsx [Salinisphaera sp.]